MINQITQENLAKHAAWLRGKPDGASTISVIFTQSRRLKRTGSFSGGSRRSPRQMPGILRTALWARRARRRLINEKWFDENMAFDAEQDSSEWDHCEARG